MEDEPTKIRRGRSNCAKGIGRSSQTPNRRLRWETARLTTPVSSSKSANDISGSRYARISVCCQVRRMARPRCTMRSTRHTYHSTNPTWWIWTHMDTWTHGWMDMSMLISTHTGPNTYQSGLRQRRKQSCAGTRGRRCAENLRGSSARRAHQLERQSPDG